MRVFQLGDCSSGRDFLEVNDGRRYLQCHEAAVWGKGHVAGVEIELQALPADRLKGFHVPEAEPVAPADDQSAAVGGEEDSRLPSDNPFVDHGSGLGIPEPHAVRVSATARQPPAILTEGDEA